MVVVAAMGRLELHREWFNPIGTRLAVGNDSVIRHWKIERKDQCDVSLDVSIQRVMKPSKRRNLRSLTQVRDNMNGSLHLCGDVRGGDRHGPEQPVRPLAQGFPVIGRCSVKFCSSLHHTRLLKSSRPSSVPQGVSIARQMASSVIVLTNLLQPRRARP